MEKLLYPMKNVAISQKEYSGISHQNIPAIDLRGEDTGIDYGRACCTCKVLGSYGTSNTLYFGSCDEQGNKARVQCADGKLRVVTFAMTHSNNISMYKVGQIIKQKDICYTEGTKGLATGNHIHFEICEGWEFPKKNYIHNGKKQFMFNPTTALKPTEVLYMEEGYNKVIDGWVDGNWKWTKKEGDETLKLKMEKLGLNLRESLTFKNKKPTGKILTTMKKGSSCVILSFIEGIQPDGYQWARADYNGLIGYCQIDTAVYFLYQ